MSVESSQVLPQNVHAPGAAHGSGTGREGELDFGRAEWENSRLVTVPVDEVRPDPKQPRKHFDEESLRELGWSLRVFQVQPIVVRRAASGWVLVDGERRWRAARAEGLATLEAREINLTERVEMVSMVIQLAANTHRDQLTLEEQALGVLRLAEGGLPVLAIARVLGHQEDHVVSLLAIARSGDARTLIDAGRLTSVTGWDAYLALEPAVRKRVLDSTDPVTEDRCERVRREYALAERSKQLRLVMPRPPARGEAEELAVAPGEDGDGAGESDAAPGALAEAGAALPGEDDIPPLRTFAAALDAFHLEAHEERDALIAGLDGVREGLDTLLTTFSGSPDVTDPVFEVLRVALVPVQQVLDAALEKIVRMPEFPPCCVLNAAARHAGHDAREEDRP